MKRPSTADCVRVLKRAGFRVTTGVAGFISLKRSDRVVLLPQRTLVDDGLLTVVARAAGMSASAMREQLADELLSQAGATEEGGAGSTPELG